MTTTVADVEDVFQASLAQLRDLANADAASPEQRADARVAFNDLLLLHGTQVIQRIEGRTAVLAGLVAELEQVAKTIRGADAMSGALDRITRVLTKARMLYDKTKEEMRSI